MTATPQYMKPLEPTIGRWRTSGVEFGVRGEKVREFEGTDAYRWAPGRHWVVHEIDIRMGEGLVQGVELIGGEAEGGGWLMLEYNAEGGPGTMRLTDEGGGLLLINGDGVRSWFTTDTRGEGRMATRWERLVDGQWIPWMDVRFDLR